MLKPFMGCDVGMSRVNRKILEAIEESHFAQDMKDFLRTLLMVELRNVGDKRPRYSEDYDRAIRKFVGIRVSSDE
jgi:hypothetical protein